MYQSPVEKFYMILSSFVYNSIHNGMLDISVLIQLFVIFISMYALYRKFIKGTTSEKLVKGIFTLLIVWLLGSCLDKIHLSIIGAFLQATTVVIAISLIVIFQPELRRLLSYLGQNDFWKLAFLSKKNKESEKKVNILKELTETVKYLSKTKTGGLIVLPNEKDVVSPFSEVGIKINSIVSSELLLTIFFPNTPLHDGAVVIRGDRIMAAGVLLPLTEDPKLSWRYGTRHRAAIGVTEVSNCACIVVSEETGSISIAQDGMLKKYESVADFKVDLQRILKIETDDNLQVEEHKSFFEFMNLKK